MEGLWLWTAVGRAEQLPVCHLPNPSGLLCLYIWGRFRPSSRKYQNVEPVRRNTWVDHEAVWVVNGFVFLFFQTVKHSVSVSAASIGSAERG